MAPSTSVVMNGNTTTNGILDQAASGANGNRELITDEYTEALALIEAALLKMSTLNALLELDISEGEGKERPYIYIDARSNNKAAHILQSCSDKPSCTLKVTPKSIKKFVRGKADPRRELFKQGFFHENSFYTGEMRVAIKFCDCLRPVNPAHPLIITDTTKLPVPTEDLNQVRHDLSQWGYGLIKNALSPHELQTLQTSIKQQAAGEVLAGVASNDGGPNAPNQRIWTLVNKGSEFHSLLEHPLIDSLVPDFLDENYLLHSYSANIARPGNVPMVLHTDQTAITPPIRNIAFGLNIMWFLSDVTHENGGTRVFPGSHMGDIALDDPLDITGTVAAQGPAGTAMVFESRLWHATGPNNMADGERPVILMFFMRSFVRQQENNFLSLRPEVEATMSDRVRRMLGFCTGGGLGGVEGEVREGRFVRRLENPVGMFRDGYSQTPYRVGIKA
jgi:hypothetical protein